MTTKTEIVRGVVTFNVLAKDREAATFAGATARNTLDTVWITEYLDVLPHPGTDVYTIQVAVQAPRCELDPYGPVVQSAGHSTGLAFDAVTAKPRHANKSGF